MKNNLSRLVAGASVVLACSTVSCSTNSSTGAMERDGDGVQDTLAATTDKADAAETVSPDSIFTKADLGRKPADLPPVNFNQAPAPAASLKVEVHSFSKYGDNEQFAREALQSLERVVNSPEFKKQVTSSSYTQPGGHSPEEIYALILKAHEEKPGGTDGVMDFRLRTITQEDDGQKWVRACGRSTIGKDGGATGVIATCPDWIEEMKEKGDQASLADHYMHEYLHTIGFSHYGLVGRQRDNSVPYQIGYLVDDLVTNPNQALQGTVAPDQKFETLIDGYPRKMRVFKTDMQVPGAELLDLSKYVGKKIKIKVQRYTDAEAYGAVIVR